MVGGETMSHRQEIPYFFNSSELSILALIELDCPQRKFTH